MTQSTNDRAQAALLRLQAALLRDNPRLDDGALTRLLAVGAESLGFRAFVYGKEPDLDLSDMVAEVKGSGIARFIYAPRDDQDPVDQDVDPDLSPAARINAFRSRKGGA